MTLIVIVDARKTSRTQSHSLVRGACLEEVKKVIFGMKMFGSLGPDRILTGFYQHFWGDAGLSLTSTVNQMLNSGSVNKSLLQAFVTLISEKEVPESAVDFRPITLMNVAFKVISKILVNR